MYLIHGFSLFDSVGSKMSGGESVELVNNEVVVTDFGGSTAFDGTSYLTNDTICLRKLYNFVFF